MQLLDDAQNLLTNTTLMVLAAPTPIDALRELPPASVAAFWDVINAAVKVVDRARAEQLLGERGERENLDRLCTMLTRALNLYHDALSRAAIPEEELRRQLDQWDPEPGLEDVLIRRYFYQIRGLMTRIAEYGQAVLDAYDRHPVFVMDVNLLLDAVERFTGYVRPSDGTGAQTGNMDVMYLLRAIAGKADTWFDRTSPFSEFHMLSGTAVTTPEKWKGAGREPAETKKYLGWVWSGVSAEEVTKLRAWQAKAWADKKLNPKTKYPRDFATFPDIQKDGESKEIWFFINGVVTDHWIAQLNAEHIADTFKRPVHILHNPTEGLHRDIGECVRGRILQERVDVAEDLRKQLVKLAGRGNGKLVLVAHSQGTIIASEIVKELREQNAYLLPRLEVFNFAFCADEFPEESCRHVEHFANENDFVAALSLAGNPYNVPGAIFRRAGAWGHFLGAHYLDGLAQGAYKDAQGSHGSVLFRYIGGSNYGTWL